MSAVKSNLSDFNQIIDNADGIVDDSAEVAAALAASNENTNEINAKTSTLPPPPSIARIAFGDSAGERLSYLDDPPARSVEVAFEDAHRDALSQGGRGREHPALAASPSNQSPPRGALHLAPSEIAPGDDELSAREVIIDRNGQPRQAGASTAEGAYIQRFKKRAEESLYIFGKGVLNRHFLTPHFHQDVCKFIQKVPPFRKLVMLPREHAKTTIVSGALPPHILIQPAETNIYFPGLAGSECRILLCGETETMAKKNLRVIQSVFMENKVFRAFWPERVWESARRKQWSSESMIIPRENEWPDPTVRAVGVGGAITGARPNVMIKDDLVSFKASQSEVVMDEAIEWHKVSRALLDTYEVESGLQSLEFIIGCLTSDSMVTMGDGTKREINQVKVGEYVWQATEGGYIQRAKVKAVILQGHAETWTISTTAHDIRATGTHPFLISVGRNELAWKRADQLREGDLIVAHKKIVSFCESKQFDEEFCWLFGFMFGDGWVNDRPRKGYVCFSPGIDEAQNQRVLDAFSRYVPCNKWYMTPGGYYRTDSVKAARYFAELGFNGNAKTKRIPVWVYQLKQAQQIAFLRGFCDADGGWQNHQTWRVEISNRELLEDLRHVACLCGVRTGRLLMRERAVQPPNSPHPIRSVCFSASFNFAAIDRHETVNKNLYGGINVGRDTKLVDELRFERVIEVKRNKIAEEVWDLTVDGNHSFFANGLAVHNTRWAVFDLYSYIVDNDPSVEVIDSRYHSIIRDGNILWPEKNTLERIAQLQQEYGSMFYLLYMNNASDPELVDFDMELVRYFRYVEGKIVFDEDDRDAKLERRIGLMKGEIKHPPVTLERGTRLTPSLLDRLTGNWQNGYRMRGI